MRASIFHFQVLKCEERVRDEGVIWYINFFIILRSVFLDTVFYFNVLHKLRGGHGRHGHGLQVAIVLWKITGGLDGSPFHLTQIPCGTCGLIIGIVGRGRPRV